MRLKEKVALITGGASGIGEATALKFIREGAKVVAVDMNEEKLKSLADKIESMDGQCLTLTGDVTDSQVVKEIFSKAIKKYGKLDILVNNAGITIDSKLVKLSEEDFDKVVNVNLKGVYLCGKEAASYMMESGGGVILNASSVVGVYGNFGQTNYAATKWGVIGMTKTWAKELGKFNIRSNAVAPGFILSPMTEKMPEKVLNFMADKSPLKRLGNVEDIANAYCFLASDESKFITGAVLSVDGGVVL